MGQNILPMLLSSIIRFLRTCDLALSFVAIVLVLYPPILCLTRVVILLLICNSKRQFQRKILDKFLSYYASIANQSFLVLVCSSRPCLYFYHHLTSSLQLCRTMFQVWLAYVLFQCHYIRLCIIFPVVVIWHSGFLNYTNKNVNTTMLMWRPSNHILGVFFVT